MRVGANAAPVRTPDIRRWSWATGIRRRIDSRPGSVPRPDRMSVAGRRRAPACRQPRFVPEHRLDSLCRPRPRSAGCRPCRAAPPETGARPRPDSAHAAVGVEVPHAGQGGVTVDAFDAVPAAKLLPEGSRGRATTSPTGPERALVVLTVIGTPFEISWGGSLSGTTTIAGGESRFHHSWLGTPDLGPALFDLSRRRPPGVPALPEGPSCTCSSLSRRRAD